jgi:hypothetical protein
MCSSQIENVLSDKDLRFWRWCRCRMTLCRCRWRQQLHTQQHSVTSRKILTRSQSCDWTTCLAFLPSVNPAFPCRGLMSGNPQSHCFIQWVSFVISCVWMSSYVNMIDKPVLVWWNSDPIVDVSLTCCHVACCTVGVKCVAAPSWYSPWCVTLHHHGTVREVWRCTIMVQSAKCEAAPSWYSPIASSYLTACHIYSLL